MSLAGVMVRVESVNPLDPRSPSDPAKIGDAAKIAVDNLVQILDSRGGDPAKITLDVRASVPRILQRLGMRVEYVVRARAEIPD